MGQLTTHVLDTTHGRAAAGVRIELFKLAAGERHRLADSITNADGRCDAPLLSGDAFTRGTYELLFHMGEYFAAAGVALPTPAFVDIVSLRFGIAEPSAHYHVPLLVSPWSYSTYRGS